MLEKKKKQEIVKLDIKQFVTESTKPANFKHVKTTALAVKDKSDSLASVKAKAGKKVSLNILKIWIVNLNDFLNISRKMTPDQIDETADMIYDDFHYLKISDVSLIMKRIKTGYYGAFYESIDGMKLMDIFYKYAQERVNYHIDTMEREHQENKHKEQSK